MRHTGTFLRRLAIRNYKSIGACDISLGPLTVLVGRNGAGKSNVLDSLHFIADGLQTSLDFAIKSRGGIDAVRRKSTGHPRNFAIRADFDIAPDSTKATYAFEIAARASGTFAVKRERLSVMDAEGRMVSRFDREESRVFSAVTQTGRDPVMPPVLEDRLYLVNAAGLPDFRPAYDALLAMGFYNLNPDAMKGVQSPDVGELLHGNGANIASVVARLSAQQPDALDRIKAYLATIVPGIEGFNRESLGPKETLVFLQRVEGAQHPWRFYASSMSDGTLRALGALVAVTQLANGSQPIRLVGIEEPETALHPAAAGALMDALREASAHTQVLVTSHSPDIVDQIDTCSDTLLIVSSSAATSRVATADPASLAAIQQHLYSPGELLRMDQLQPDSRQIERQEQLDLFEDSNMTFVL
jgi:predicted ATPase